MKYLTSVILCYLVAESISAQTNIAQLGHLTFPNGTRCSNLTGYADTSGHEYALVGNTQGLAIVDITNPAQPSQLFLVPGATGQSGLWREVREYKGYAYVTTEQQSGLVVVNLNYLPDSIAYHTVNPGNMTTSHTIFIDENGIGYVNGTDKDQLFLDLDTNPWNPVLLGKFSNNYVHDCYVRHDTLWAACINDGILKVVDVHSKTTANTPGHTLASFATPLNFTHNCWLSADGNYLFTTDEKPDSYLTCYDVSNLNNITETDRTQVDPGTNTIIHNTYFLNNYCITSYYTYGITIHDVSRKNNLVEVGNFDTSPNFSGDGFNGAWGVWPYLPSGNIIVSDIETGLWILGPAYKRACYLEGVVRDTTCNTFINGVTIEIIEDSVTDQTNYLGKYSTGTPNAGTYTVRFSKPGYQTATYPNTILQNGVLTTINVNMVPIATSRLVVKTVDAVTGTPLPFIRILVQDSAGNNLQDFASNQDAEYAICDFVRGNYRFFAGRWGRITASVNQTIQHAYDTVVLATYPGYYDDFIMDYGWTVSGTATSGEWEREMPVATDYNGSDCNAGADITSDLGKDCFVTGNNGGNAGDDDVDNGYTLLTSPLFDLSGYQDPYLSFYTWFFNDGGSGTAPNDSLKGWISNGTDSAMVLLATFDSLQSQWVYHNIRVSNYLAAGAGMRFSLQAYDVNPGHLVEGGLDVFKIVDSAALTHLSEPEADNVLKVYPNPFSNTFWVDMESTLVQNARLEVSNSLGQVIYAGFITTTHMQVPVQNMAPGLYYIRLLNGRATPQVIKLIRRE